jgi:hypothetical protein
VPEASVAKRSGGGRAPAGDRQSIKSTPAWPSSGGAIVGRHHRCLAPGLRALSVPKKLTPSIPEILTIRRAARRGVGSSRAQEGIGASQGGESLAAAVLDYFARESSHGATISADPKKALAPHGSDLRAGRALGRSKLDSPGTVLNPITPLAVRPGARHGRGTPARADDQRPRASSPGHARRLRRYWLLGRQDRLLSGTTNSVARGFW